MKDLTDTMINIKNGNFIGYEKYLNSPEFVAYALAKAQIQGRDFVPEQVFTHLLTANDAMKKAKRIGDAMSTVDKIYLVDTVDKLNLMFSQEKTAILLQSPYSTEYVMKKLNSLDKSKKKSPEFDALLKDKIAQFKAAQKAMDISNPIEMNRMRVLAKQRQIWKNDLYGHDGFFIITSVAFMAYAGAIGEVAIVVIGGVLGTFSALKMMINNGLNWKRTVAYISEHQQSLEVANADIEKMSNGFESFKNSDLVKIIQENNMDLEVAHEFVHDRLTDIANRPETHEDTKAILQMSNDPEARVRFLSGEQPEAISARKQITDMIVQQGTIDKVVNDPTVDIEARRTLFFVADSVAALKRLKDGTELRLSDRAVLAHPNVIDVSEKLIAAEISNKKEEIKSLQKAQKNGPHDEGIVTESPNDYINKLEVQIRSLNTYKLEIRNEAGIKTAGQFFKVAAPFVATVVIALKVSLGFFFAWEIFHLHAVTLAFEAVALMSGKLYSAFLAGSVLGVTVAKIFPSIANSLTRVKPDYSDPKYVIDELAKGMMLDKSHGTSILQRTNRAILNPFRTASKIKIAMAHPVDTIKAGAKGFAGHVSEIQKNTKLFFKDKWSRIRGKGPVYSTEEQTLRDIMAQISTNQVTIEQARKELNDNTGFTQNQINTIVADISHQRVTVPPRSVSEIQALPI